MKDFTKIMVHSWYYSQGNTKSSLSVYVYVYEYVHILYMSMYKVLDGGGVLR